MRAFAGIDLARENVPDATTLLKFQRLLIGHQLTRKLFEEIGIELCARGLMMKEGTLVDATIFEASPSTKNAGNILDPAMHQTKKGNDWHRHEGACRRRRRLGGGAQRGYHGGQRVGCIAGARPAARS
jgi:transposase, IS5 family